MKWGTCICVAELGSGRHLRRWTNMAQAAVAPQTARPGPRTGTSCHGTSLWGLTSTWLTVGLILQPGRSFWSTLMLQLLTPMFLTSPCMHSASAGPLFLTARCMCRTCQLITMRGSRPDQPLPPCEAAGESRPSLYWHVSCRFKVCKHVGWQPAHLLHTLLHCLPRLDERWIDVVSWLHWLCDRPVDLQAHKV